MVQCFVAKKVLLQILRNIERFPPISVTIDETVCQILVSKHISIEKTSYFSFSARNSETWRRAFVVLVFYETKLAAKTIIWFSCFMRRTVPRGRPGLHGPLALWRVAAEFDRTIERA